MSWLREMEVRPTGRRFAQDPEPLASAVCVDEEYIKADSMNMRYDDEYLLQVVLQTRMRVPPGEPVHYAKVAAEQSLVRHIFDDVFRELGPMYRILCDLRAHGNYTDVEAFQQLETAVGNISAICQGERRR